MKNIFAALFTLFMLSIAALSFASPSSATGGSTTPSPDNKQVTLCHATNSEKNPYVKITVDVNAVVVNGHGGHEGDIIPPFPYTTKGGEVVTYSGQGDQTLLAFDDCQKPKVDEELAVPAVNKVDKCETDNDSVTPVRDNTKYTTDIGRRVGDSVVVTFTALDGFTFADGKVVTVTVDFPNNDDCDLPETGGAATYNTMLGGAALAGVIALAGATLLTRKRV